MLKKTGRLVSSVVPAKEEIPKEAHVRVQFKTNQYYRDYEGASPDIWVPLLIEKAKAIEIAQSLGVEAKFALFTPEGKMMWEI